MMLLGLFVEYWFSNERMKDTAYMTKGTELLTGVLSQDEIDEFDALEEICSVCDGNIKLIERKTELLRKATALIKKRNEELMKETIAHVVQGGMPLAAD